VVLGHGVEEISSVSIPCEANNQVIFLQLEPSKHFIAQDRFNHRAAPANIDKQTRSAVKKIMFVLVFQPSSCPFSDQRQQFFLCKNQFICGDDVLY
jgi:hypothetical protein